MSSSNSNHSDGWSRTPQRPNSARVTATNAAVSSSAAALVPSTSSYYQSTSTTPSTNMKLGGGGGGTPQRSPRGISSASAGGTRGMGGGLVAPPSTSASQLQRQLTSRLYKGGGGAPTSSPNVAVIASTSSTTSTRPPSAHLTRPSSASVTHTPTTGGSRPSAPSPQQRPPHPQQHCGDQQTNPLPKVPSKAAPEGLLPFAPVQKPLTPSDLQDARSPFTSSSPPPRQDQRIGNESGFGTDNVVPTPIPQPATITLAKMEAMLSDLRKLQVANYVERLQADAAHENDDPDRRFRDTQETLDRSRVAKSTERDHSRMLTETASAAGGTSRRHRRVQLQLPVDSTTDPLSLLYVLKSHINGGDVNEKNNQNHTITPSTAPASVSAAVKPFEYFVLRRYPADMMQIYDPYYLKRVGEPPTGHSTDDEEDDADKDSNRTVADVTSSKSPSSINIRAFDSTGLVDDESSAPNNNSTNTTFTRSAALRGSAGDHAAHRADHLDIRVADATRELTKAETNKGSYLGNRRGRLSGNVPRRYFIVSNRGVTSVNSAKAFKYVVPASNNNINNSMLPLPGLDGPSSPSSLPEGIIAEYTPFSDWLREYNLFRRLKTIPFFRNMRQEKYVMAWRMAMIAVTRDYVSRSLSKTLFVLDEDVNTTLMAVRLVASRVEGASAKLPPPQSQIQQLSPAQQQRARSPSRLQLLTSPSPIKTSSSLIRRSQLAPQQRSVERQLLRALIGQAEKLVRGVGDQRVVSGGAVGERLLKLLHDEEVSNNELDDEIGAEMAAATPRFSFIPPQYILQKATTGSAAGVLSCFFSAGASSKAASSLPTSSSKKASSPQRPVPVPAQSGGATISVVAAPKSETLLGFDVRTLPPHPDYAVEHTFEVEEFVSRHLAFHRSHAQATLKIHQAQTQTLVDEGCHLFQRNQIQSDPDLQNPHVSSFTILSKKKAIRERSMRLRRLCDLLFVEALVHNAVANIEKFRMLFEDSAHKTSMRQAMLASASPKRRATKFGQAVDRAMSEQRRRMSTSVGFTSPFSANNHSNGVFNPPELVGSPLSMGRGRRSSIHLSGSAPGDTKPTASGIFAGGFDVSAIEELSGSPHFIAPRRNQRRSHVAESTPQSDPNDEYFALFPLVWVHLKIVTREDLLEEERILSRGGMASSTRQNHDSDGDAEDVVIGGRDQASFMAVRRQSIRRVTSMANMLSGGGYEDDAEGLGGVLSRRPSMLKRVVSDADGRADKYLSRRAEKESLLQFYPDAETVTSLIDRAVASIVMRSAQVPNFFSEPETASTATEGLGGLNNAQQQTPLSDEAPNSTNNDVDSKRNLIVTHPRYRPAVDAIHRIIHSNYKDITTFCKPLRAWCNAYDELDDIILESQSLKKQLAERDGVWYQDVITKVRQHMSIIEGLDMYPRIGFIQLDLTPLLISMRRKLGEVLKHVGSQLPILARIRNETFLKELTKTYNKMVSEPLRAHFGSSGNGVSFGGSGGANDTSAGNLVATNSTRSSNQLISNSGSGFTGPIPSANTPSGSGGGARVGGRSRATSISAGPPGVAVSRRLSDNPTTSCFAPLGPLTEAHQFVQALVEHFTFCASVSEGLAKLESQYDEVKDFHRILDDEPDLLDELDMGALRSADDIETLQSGTGTVMVRLRDRAAAFEQNREKYVSRIQEQMAANVQALKEACKTLSATLHRDSRFQDASLVRDIETTPITSSSPHNAADTTSNTSYLPQNSVSLGGITSMGSDFSALMIGGGVAPPQEVSDNVEALTGFSECSGKLSRMENEYMRMHHTFGFDFTRPPEVKEATGVVSSMLMLWATIQKWSIFSVSARQELIKQMPVDLGTTVENFSNTLRQCARFNAKNPALQKVVGLVRLLEEYVPIVEALRNKHLTSQHWAAINKMVELYLRKRFNDTWANTAREQHRRTMQLHLQRQLNALGGGGTGESAAGVVVSGSSLAPSTPVDPTAGYDPDQPLTSDFTMLSGAVSAAQQAGVVFPVSLEAGNDSLQWLIDNEIVVITTHIVSVSVAATNEAQLDKEISHITRQWAGGAAMVAPPIIFHTKQFKNHKDVYVLDAQVEDEVLPLLSESSVRTASALANRHCIGILRQRAERLQAQLKLMELCVRTWVQFQQDWIFLENVFGQSDISRQWPVEEAMFKPVDHTFKEIMRHLKTLPSVYHAATNRQTLVFFLSGLRTLEALRKALDRKIELKRQLFPRLYFLSDSDVLDILSQTKNPQRIAQHYSKLFDGVKSVVQMPNTIVSNISNSTSGASLNWGAAASMSFASPPAGINLLPSASASVSSPRGGGGAPPPTTTPQQQPSTLNVIIGVLSADSVYLPLTSTASANPISGGAGMRGAGGGSSAAATTTISGVPQRGDVEKWLQSLEHHISQSVRQDVNIACQALLGAWQPQRIFSTPISSERSLSQHPLEVLLGNVGASYLELGPYHPIPPFKYLPQTILAVSWASWCGLVELALDYYHQDACDEAPLKDVLGWVNTGLAFLTQLSSSTLGPQYPKHRYVAPTDPRVHSLLCALITQQIHIREVTERLIKGGITTTNDFEWSRVLRMDIEPVVVNNSNNNSSCANIISSSSSSSFDSILVCRQLNTSLAYSHEFLGAQTRLVITPVTEKVYLTIMTALAMNMGAAPAGPAGTGKTETVKDLAKFAAKQCIVYNCSEGVTYTMTAQLFAGLVQSGCWACLDEFNRIHLSVLSAVASQILSIKSALDRNLKTFNFLDGDDELVIRPGSGVFITMNPGYAGRTELPDNLKALFRPVAVTIPDSRRIAEVTLLSEGFHTADILARRTTTLLSLCSQQLSKCDHYDFSMRALKSILTVAGKSRQSRAVLVSGGGGMSGGGGLANVPDMEGSQFSQTSRQNSRRFSPPCLHLDSVSAPSAEFTRSGTVGGNKNGAAAPFSSKFVPAPPPQTSLSAHEEATLMYNACWVCTIPKLLERDIGAFTGMIQDLFGVDGHVTEMVAPQRPSSFSIQSDSGLDAGGFPGILDSTAAHLHSTAAGGRRGSSPPPHVGGRQTFGSGGSLVSPPHSDHSPLVPTAASSPSDLLEEILRGQHFTIEPLLVLGVSPHTNSEERLTADHLRMMIRNTSIPCRAAHDPFTLVLHKPMLKKVTQLYETLQLRFGVMVLGAASSGKTAIMDGLSRCYTVLPLPNSTTPHGHGQSNALSTISTQDHIPNNNRRRSYSTASHQQPTDTTTARIPAHLPVSQYHRVNPKSMSYGQLFGIMNPTTGDWTDGVLVKISREIMAAVNGFGPSSESSAAPNSLSQSSMHPPSQHQHPQHNNQLGGSSNIVSSSSQQISSAPETLSGSNSPHIHSLSEQPSSGSYSRGGGMISESVTQKHPPGHHPHHQQPSTMQCNWVVFDGPVDTLWVESLNSVLDDSRLLCLDNGERLKLPDPHMRILFEVTDLQHASPATVSRCGMVCLNPSDTTPSAPLDKYLRLAGTTLGPHVEAYLRITVERIFLTAMEGFYIYVYHEDSKGLPTSGGADREMSGAAEKAMAMRRRTSPNAMLPQSQMQIYSNFVMILESCLRLQDCLILQPQQHNQFGEPIGENHHLHHASNVDGGGWCSSMTTSLDAAPTAHEAALSALRAAKHGTEKNPDASQNGGPDSVPWTSMLDVVVAYATVWSVGSDLSEVERDQFDTFMRQLTETVPTVAVSEVAAASSPSPASGRRQSISTRRASVAAAVGSMSQEDTIIKLLASAGTCAAFPPRDTVFDYAPPATHLYRTGWQHWAIHVPSFSYCGPFSGKALSRHLYAQREELMTSGTVSAGTPSPLAIYYADFSNTLVPTTDSVRLSHFIHRIVGSRLFGARAAGNHRSTSSCSASYGNVVVCGDTGVGKSLMLQGVLAEHYSGTTTIQTSFSFGYSVPRLYNTIEERLDAATATTNHTADNAKRVILVVDDANLPAIGEYGASGLQEALRFVVEQRAFYDREKLSLRTIPCLSTVLCVSPSSSSGGRHNNGDLIPARLARHFVSVRISRQSPASLQKIFTALLTGHFGGAQAPLDDVSASSAGRAILAAQTLATTSSPYETFTPEVRSLVKPVIGATIDVLLETQRLGGGGGQAQVSFSAKDAMRCLQGVSRCDPQTVRSSTHLAQLWLHEVQRCFLDRLASEDHISEWNSITTDVALRHNLRGALVQTRIPRYVSTATSGASPAPQQQTPSPNTQMGERDASTADSDNVSLVAAIIESGDEDDATTNTTAAAASHESPSQLLTTYWVSAPQGTVGLGLQLYEPYLAISEMQETIRSRLLIAGGGGASSPAAQQGEKGGGSSATSAEGLISLAAYPRINLVNNIVLFPYCCANIAKVARILDEPRGAASIIGSPGTGKRTVVKLAALLANFKVVEAAPTQKRSFRDHVVAATLAAAACCQEGSSTTGVVLLVSDANVDDDAAFEDTNCLLQGGTIPGLFTNEIKSNIFVTYSSIRQQALVAEAARAKVEGRIVEDEAMQLEEASEFIADAQLHIKTAADGGVMFDPAATIVVETAVEGGTTNADGTTSTPQTPDDVMKYFLEEARKRLRIIVCLSSDPIPLQRRVSRFPALVGATTSMWIAEWPRDALRTLAASQLVPYAYTADDLRTISNNTFEDADEDISKQIALALRSSRLQHLKGICRLCARLHYAAQSVSMSVNDDGGNGVCAITSGKYVQCLQMAQRMLIAVREKLQAHRTKMQLGVANMVRTLEQVAAMEGEVRRMEPLIVQKTKSILELTEDVKIKSAEAKVVAEQVEEKRWQAKDQETAAKAIQSEAQREMDTALPEWRKAVNALAALRKQDIDEIKKYSQPPTAVQTTIEAVLVILGEKKTDWATARITLGDPKNPFIDRLLSLKVTDMEAVHIDRVQKYIHNEDFTPQVVGTSGSEACKSLCIWVRAVEHYYHVEKRIAPKREMLRQAEEELMKAKALLEEAKKELEAAQRKCAELNQTLMNAHREKRELQDAKALLDRRLAAARVLSTSLADEQRAWESSIKETQAKLRQAPAEMVLTAALIVYGAALGAPQRLTLRHAAAECFRACGVTTSSTDVTEWCVNFRLEDSFTAVQVKQWQLHQLPTDDHSKETASMVLQTVDHAPRWPLVLDPQQQFMKWLTTGPEFTGVVMEANEGGKCDVGSDLDDEDETATTPNTVPTGNSINESGMSPPPQSDAHETTLNPMSLDPYLLHAPAPLPGETLLSSGVLPNTIPTTLAVYEVDRVQRALRHTRANSNLILNTTTFGDGAGSPGRSAGGGGGVSRTYSIPVPGLRVEGSDGGSVTSIPRNQIGNVAVLNTSPGSVERRPSIGRRGSFLAEVVRRSSRSGSLIGQPPLTPLTIGSSTGMLRPYKGGAGQRLSVSSQQQHPPSSANNAISAHAANHRASSPSSRGSRARPSSAHNHHSSGVIAIPITHPRLLHILRQAIPKGSTVILHSVKGVTASGAPSNIPAVLTPLLERNVLQTGGVVGGSASASVQLGDDTLDYNPTFKLVLVCSQPQATFDTSVLNRVIVVDAVVSNAGLQEHVLSNVVTALESPLESEQTATIQRITALKRQATSTEERLLSLLANSSGNILDNQALVDQVVASKKLSIRIIQQALAAEEKSKQLHHKRQVYSPVAACIARVCFAVAAMGRRNPLYHFSLDYIVDRLCIPIVSEYAGLTQHLSDAASFEKENVVRAVRKRLDEAHAEELFHAHKQATTASGAAKKPPRFNLYAALEALDVGVTWNDIEAQLEERRRRAILELSDTECEIIQAIHEESHRRKDELIGALCSDVAAYSFERIRRTYSASDRQEFTALFLTADCVCRLDSAHAKHGTAVLPHVAVMSILGDEPIPSNINCAQLLAAIDTTPTAPLSSKEEAYKELDSICEKLSTSSTPSSTTPPDSSVIYFAKLLRRSVTTNNTSSPSCGLPPFWKTFISRHRNHKVQTTPLRTYLSNILITLSEGCGSEGDTKNRMDIMEAMLSPDVMQKWEAMCWIDTLPIQPPNKSEIKYLSSRSTSFVDSPLFTPKSGDMTKGLDKKSLIAESLRMASSPLGDWLATDRGGSSTPLLPPTCCPWLSPLSTLLTTILLKRECTADAADLFAKSYLEQCRREAQLLKFSVVIGQYASSGASKIGSSGNHQRISILRYALSTMITTERANELRQLLADLTEHIQQLQVEAVVVIDPVAGGGVDISAPSPSRSSANNRSSSSVHHHTHSPRNSILLSSGGSGADRRASPGKYGLANSVASMSLNHPGSPLGQTWGSVSGINNTIIRPLLSTLLEDSTLGASQLLATLSNLGAGGGGGSGGDDFVGSPLNFFTRISQEKKPFALLDSKIGGSSDVDGVSSGSPIPPPAGAVSKTLSGGLQRTTSTFAGTLKHRLTADQIAELPLLERVPYLCAQDVFDPLTMAGPSPNGNHNRPSSSGAGVSRTMSTRTRVVAVSDPSPHSQAESSATHLPRRPLSAHNSMINLFVAPQEGDGGKWTVATPAERYQQALATHALLTDTMPMAYASGHLSTEMPNQFPPAAIQPPQELLVVCGLDDHEVHTVLADQQQWGGGSPQTAASIRLPTAMAATSSECDPQQPILVLVPPGTDPTERVDTLCRRQFLRASTVTMTKVSLGQGQEHAALKAVVRGASTGEWVLLANAHLSDAILANLERLLAAIKERPTRTPPTAEELEHQRRVKEEADHIKAQQDELAAQQQQEEEALLQAQEERLKSRKRCGASSSKTAGARYPGVGAHVISEDESGGVRKVPTSEVSDLLNTKEPLHRRLRALLGADGTATSKADDDDGMTIEEIRNSKTMSDLEKRKRIKKINERLKKRVAHIKRRLAKREERRQRGNSSALGAAHSQDHMSSESDLEVSEDDSSVNSIDVAIRKLTISVAVSAAHSGGGGDGNVSSAAQSPAPNRTSDPAHHHSPPQQHVGLSRAAEGELVAKLLKHHHAVQAEKIAASRGAGSGGEEDGGGPAQYLLSKYLPLLPDSIHPNFRLWISCSDSFDNMPQAMTEGCMKCAFIAEEENDNSSDVREDAAGASSFDDGITTPQLNVTTVGESSSVAPPYAAHTATPLSSGPPHPPDPIDYLMDVVMKGALKRFFTAVVDRARSIGTGEAYVASIRSFYANIQSSSSFSATGSKGTSGGGGGTTLAALGLGWNKAYPFSSSDQIVTHTLLTQFLRIGVKNIQRTTQDQAVSMARYLVAELTVGGRITDGHDVTLLHAHYNRFIAPAVRLVHTVAKSSNHIKTATINILDQLGCDASYIASLLPVATWAEVGRIARTANTITPTTEAIWEVSQGLVRLSDGSTPQQQIPELGCPVCSGCIVAPSSTAVSTSEQKAAMMSSSTTAFIAPSPFPATYTGSFFGLHPSVENARRTALGMHAARLLRTTLPLVMTTTAFASPSQQQKQTAVVAGGSSLESARVEGLLVICYHVLIPLLPAPICIIPRETVQEREQELATLLGLEAGMYEFPVVIDDRDPLSSCLVYEAQAFNAALERVKEQLQALMYQALSAVSLDKARVAASSQQVLQPHHQPPPVVEKHMRALNKAIATAHTQQQQQRTDAGATPLTPAPPTTSSHAAPRPPVPRTSSGAPVKSARSDDEGKLPSTLPISQAHDFLLAYVSTTLQQLNLSTSQSSSKKKLDASSALDDAVGVGESLSTSGYVPVSWRRDLSGSFSSFTLSSLEGHSNSTAVVDTLLIRLEEAVSQSTHLLVEDAISRKRSSRLRPHDRPLPPLTLAALGDIDVDDATMAPIVRWILALRSRGMFLQSWYQRHEDTYEKAIQHIRSTKGRCLLDPPAPAFDPSRHPLQYYAPAFINIAKLLTAQKQAFVRQSRENGLHANSTIENVKFSTQISSTTNEDADILSPVTMTIVLTGLKSTGFVWDTHYRAARPLVSLSTCDHQTASLPPLALVPEISDATTTTPHHQQTLLLPCPLNYTASRMFDGNYITELYLPVVVPHTTHTTTISDEALDTSTTWCLARPSLHIS